ncbi:MAG: hypothetical protein OEY20_12500 [Gemmatimonadota bacterium]|nr:hypothetical protein [Gemmatimonadota bacterium]MDH4350204.1 hypothetical protein [Gemmatimonadota bacterium]MDH5198058.1 hypothetical protein [Gemmatimonadota bacterium]
MRWLLGLVWLVLVSHPAAGQVAMPDSATKAGYRQLLLELRDTVGAVAARGNEFRRDLQTVGETTVLSRAARLEAACVGARQALDEARSELAAAKFAAHHAGVRDTLVTAIGALTTSLERDCHRGLSPTGPGSRADTLRAWGPNRTARLTQAISGYHAAVGRFARRLGIDLIVR